MSGTPPGFLVRFPAPPPVRGTVGVGFVVDAEHVLTCAHVVNAALGHDLLRQDKPEPDEIVTLRLPMRGDAIREARVDRWLPPPRSGIAGGDIAGLVIREESEPLPPDLQPARLSQETPPGGEVRLFGYPVEVPRPAGGWVSCRLHDQVGNGLLQLDSDPAAAWRAQLGYSGTPVLDRTDAVVAMFKAASEDERDRDSYAIGSARLREAWDEVLGVLPPCPYKRLVAFEEEDHEIFVGREEDVARLAKAVQRSPVVLVVGPSGVGKSSLVQAGLLPALRNAGTWTVTRCRPGSMPFHELAAALFRAEGGAPVAEALRQRAAEIRSGGLADLAATIHIARGRRLLVVVDQIEELFTAGHEAVVVEDFLEAILSLLTDQQGATVVATVRADFSHRLLAHPDAAPRLDGRFVPLSPLGADAVRRVVRKPAKLRGVEFASGLVDRIVRDARADAGALPLLEFTLSELWPRQRQRVLTHEAYEEIGGLEGSLRAHAEAAVTTLIDNGTSAATLRGALLALISRTGDRMPVTRRTCPVAELPTDQQAVINSLAGARLVITDTDRAGRQVAELAHEFLLHAWPRLADLAEDDAAFVRWRGEVEQWQAMRADLLPDPMIAEARRWCDERPEETESIRDLVERSEAEQHRRVRELEEARDAARTAAKHADALRLAAQAELAGRRPAGLTAMLALAAESLRAAPTFEGDAVVRRALGIAALPVSRLTHDGSVHAVVFSPDGSRVATASRDGTARVFDAVSGAEQARLAHDGSVWSVVFSPDGSRVATASGDGTARVIPVDAGVLLEAVEQRIPRPLTDTEWERYGGPRSPITTRESCAAPCRSTRSCWRPPASALGFEARRSVSSSMVHYAANWRRPTIPMTGNSH
ncbi:MAG: AAA family ATPase [Pseudonocardiaceae bacterium]